MKHESEVRSLEGYHRKMEGLKQQLTNERNRPNKDRHPVREADIELDLKVVYNEMRKLQGLKPDYSITF